MPVARSTELSEKARQVLLPQGIWVNLDAKIYPATDIPVEHITHIRGTTQFALNRRCRLFGMAGNVQVIKGWITPAHTLAELGQLGEDNFEEGVPVRVDGRWYCMHVL